MDAAGFDRLTKTLSAGRSRRSLLGLLGSLALAATVTIAPGDESSAKRGKSRKSPRDHHSRTKGEQHPNDTKGKGQRNRNGQRKGKRNGHGSGGNGGSGNGGGGCEAESRAEACAGNCGSVENRCRDLVDCGPCVCQPPCPVCHVCDAERVQCVPDQAMVGGRCGPCATCEPDGRCQERCGDGQACDGNRCVCDSASCRSGCCDDAGVCHVADNAACGVDGNRCTNCAADHLECQSGSCACTRQSCANGCCTQSGACLRHGDQTPDACGSEGSQCAPCATDGVCERATCAGGACGIAPSDDNASGPGCGAPDVCCQGVCCGDGLTCDGQGACFCPADAPFDCGQNGICLECCSDGQCAGSNHCDNGDCATCRAAPVLCVRDRQCCDFYTNTGGCDGPGFDGSGPEKSCCRFLGVQCMTDSQCCSTICGFSRTCDCVQRGDDCTSSAQCCDGRCQNGKCVCDPTGTTCVDGVTRCCSGFCLADGAGGLKCT